ncbi:MAG: FAD binding domain-containing protein [Spirochaetaceae bacterium]
MPSKAKPVYVYYPDNLGEFLQLRRRKPDALVYAGGTFILKGTESRLIPVPQEVISLQWVEELKRVSRTDRYVELGAGCSLARIVEVGRNVLPGSFVQAFSTVAPMGVLSLATIGGNLCVEQHVLSAYPLILASESRIELRRQGNARWIPAGRLRSEDGELTIESGEIVSRIRVPLESWNVQVFAVFGRPYIRESEPVVFAGLAKTDAGVVDDFRMVFSAHDRILFRDRELEAELVGRRAPLPARETQSFMRRLEALLGEAGSSRGSGLSSLQRRRVLGSARRMISRFSR